MIRLSLAAAAIAVLALAGPAYADPLDDAVAWMTSIGLKHSGAPYTRDTASKLYQVDLSYGVDMTKFKPEDLRHIAALPGVRTFAMRNKSFDDAVAAEVAKLRQLTTVHATESTMTDKGLVELAKLPALDTLRIGGSMFTPSPFTAEGFKTLASMPKLRDLDISQSQAGDAGLIALKAAPQLTQLYMIGARNVGRPGLAALASMKTLRGLVMQWVDVNEEVEALAASTSLDDITFMGSAQSKVVLDDAGAVHLAKIKSLTKVVVWHTKVTDKTMAALATLPKLRTLIINKTAIGDEGFKAFANHPELTTIWADETQITDASAPVFASLKKLGSLNLEATKLTDAGLLTMAANPSITSITARKTAVTDDGVTKAKAVNAKLRVSKQASGVEEHRLALALHVDVEAVDVALALRDQRVAPLGRHALQHRVGGVGRRLVGEVDARIGMQQHAAHEDDDVDVRRLLRIDTAGLDGVEDEAVLGVGAGPGAAEALEARVRAARIGGMSVAAPRVGLP